MALGGWQVAALIRFSSNGATVMGGIARSTAMANAQLQRQQGVISANQLQMMRYTARMAEARAAMLRLGIAAAGLGAAVGFAGIATAVTDASKLQQILLSIKNETGATGAQLGQFYNTAMTIANQNAMTPVEAGEILRTISRLTAGQFTVAQMMRLAPNVAAFASNIHYNRPEIGVNEAAATGLQTAHLFRAYQPAVLSKLLDSVYRLSGLMAEKPDQALRQMSYYVPMFKTLGVGNETSIALMALLDRAGFRNKVGTNVRAEVLESLGPLKVTQHAQSGALGLLKMMGIFNRAGRFAWNNADGTLNFFGELAQLGKWEAAQIKAGVPRGKIAQEMYSAFGKQGGTIASLFGDPQMTGILKQIQAYLRDPNVGLKAATQNRQAGLGFQFSRAVNNFTAVMTELGTPWLNQLASFFRGIGDSLHNFQAWLHQHRDAEKQIGTVAAGLTAMLGSLAVLGGAFQIANVTGLSRVVSWLFDGLMSLVPWIGRFAAFVVDLNPVIAGISLAIGALFLARQLPDIASAITRWWQRYQSVVAYTAGYVFGAIGRLVVQGLQGLLGMASAGFSSGYQALISNGWKLLTPGGNVSLGMDIGNAITTTLKNYRAQGTGAVPSFVTGATSGFGGKGYDPHPHQRVNIQTLKIEVQGAHDPIATSKAVLDGFRDLVQHPLTLMSRNGNAGTHPLIGNGSTIGNAAFNSN